ncbi:hypothetical protein GCM10022287_02190 [Gryllotalpicola koreensis]|uniref:Hemerythrin-like domain-containing protein n=1 Tax=Gryllotalpicola koreensis TaxID=993086 RepID=A0ABP7ZR19_9MICO
MLSKLDTEHSAIRQALQLIDEHARVMAADLELAELRILVTALTDVIESHFRYEERGGCFTRGSACVRCWRSR